MIASPLSGRRLPVGTVLLALACAACTGKGDQAAEPRIADPAPTAIASPAEDRGRQPAEAANPGADERALGHVDGGDAERAASKRGHDSAAEAATAVQSGSGG